MRAVVGLHSDRLAVPDSENIGAVGNFIAVPDLSEGCDTSTESAFPIWTDWCATVRPYPSSEGTFIVPTPHLPIYVSGSSFSGMARLRSSLSECLKRVTAGCGVRHRCGHVTKGIETEGAHAERYQIGCTSGGQRRAIGR